MPDLGFALPDDMSPSLDFPGVSLPSITDVEYIRDLRGLSGDVAAFAIACKWWSRIAIAAEDSRLFQEASIAHANECRAVLRHLQAWIEHINWICNGLIDPSTSLSIGNVPPTLGVSYGVVSAGTSVVCQILDNNSPDPRAMSWTTYRPDEDGIGWEQDASGFAMPVFGSLKPGGSSKLRYHAGKQIKGITIPEGFTGAVGETFTILLHGSLAGMTDKYPADSAEPVTADVWIYPPAASAGWTLIKDFHPRFYKQASYELTSLSTAMLEVVGLAMRCDTDTRTYSTVTITRAGVDEAHSNSILSVEHTPGGYKTMIDLTGVDLTGVSKITVTGWFESADDDAVCLGTDRCLHSVEDFSGSWGGHYCALRQTASGAAAYKAACYQWRTCNSFAEQTDVRSPFDQTIVKQLMFGAPWVVQQYMAGVPYQFLSRPEVCTPSLASLAGLLQSLAGGYHIIKTWLHSGCCAQADTAGGELRHQRGLNAMTWYGKAAPNFLDDDTLEEGPGAHLFARGEALDGAPFPNGNLDAQTTLCDPVVHPYRLGQPTGNFGHYQRFRDYVCLIPSFVSPPPGGVGYEDGTLYANPTDVDHPTVMRLRALRFNRADDVPAWGEASAVGSTIKAATVASPEVQLWLKHQTFSASTYLGVNQTEFASAWNQGGGNVALPEYYYPKNWACAGGLCGVQKNKFDIGMTAIIDGLKYYIVQAKPCADGSHTDSWIPGNGFHLSVQTGGGNIWYYCSTTGTVLSELVVKRDGAATGDKAVTLTLAPSGTRPHYMAKDEYWYRYEDDGTNCFLYLYFSPLNDTASALDRGMYINFKLGGVAQAEKVIDISTNASKGWAITTKKVITVPSTVTGIDNVTVEREDGQIDTLTAQNYSPSHYFDWIDGRYRAEKINSTTWWVWVSPSYADNQIRIAFIGAPSSMSESTYYSTYVSPHGEYALTAWDSAQGTLPDNHSAWANRCDKIVLYDPMGRLASAGALVGEAVSASWGGVFDPLGLTVESRLQGDITADCIFDGAEGDVYLPPLEAGDSVSFVGKFADRTGLVSVHELGALCAALENIVS